MYDQDFWGTIAEWVGAAGALLASAIGIGAWMAAKAANKAAAAANTTAEKANSIQEEIELERQRFEAAKQVRAFWILEPDVPKEEGSEDKEDKFHVVVIVREGGLGEIFDLKIRASTTKHEKLLDIAQLSPGIWMFESVRKKQPDGSQDYSGFGRAKRLATIPEKAIYLPEKQKQQILKIDFSDWAGSRWQWVRGQGFHAVEPTSVTQESSGNRAASAS